MNKKRLFTGKVDCLPAAQSMVQSGRTSILMMLIFTFVNGVLFALGTGTYFLYSNFFSYLLFQYGYTFLMTTVPGEMYTLFDEEVSGDVLRVEGIVFIVLAVIILLALLLCWACSKKQIGWLIAGTVIFSLDTILVVGMLLENVSMFLDLIIHVICLASMIRAIVYDKKIRRGDFNPKEELVQEGMSQDFEPIAMSEKQEEEQVLEKPNDDSTGAP